MNSKKSSALALLVSLLMSACGAATSTPSAPIPTAPPVVQTVQVLQTVEVVKTVEVEKTVIVTGTPLPTPKPVGTPQMGGELIFAHAQDVDTLDPQQSNVSTVGLLARNMFDTLVMYDDKGNLNPALADSWKISDDATTYTFQLHKGVTFQDASPFNADAVKFNFDRITTKGFTAGIAGATLGNFDSATVIDPLTVQIKFSKPNVVFMDALTQPYLSMVSPAGVQKWGDAFGHHPVGTGPFKFVEWVEKDHITMERNPDYNWASPAYKHNGPAYLDRVTVKIVPEDGTRVSAFYSGEVDGMYNVPPTELTKLQSDPKYYPILLLAPGTSVGIPINTEKPPTNELAVRQAIEYAIDRTGISHTLRKDVDPPAGGPLSPSTWAYDPLVETYYPYNPDKAKKILDDAGWKPGSDGIREKNGQKLSLIMLQPKDLMGWMEFVQANLKDVGMDVQIQAMPISAWLAAAGAGKGNMAGLALEGFDPNVLANQYSSTSIGGSGFNWARYRDAGLDKLLQDGATTPDRGARARIYSAVQRQIMDQALWAPIYNIASLTAMHSYVHNYVLDVTREFHQFYDVYLTK